MDNLHTQLCNITFKFQQPCGKLFLDMLNYLLYFHLGGVTVTDLETLWDTIKESFKNDVSSVTYENLIEPAKALSLANNQLTIELPTPFHKDYWRDSLTDKFRLYAFEATSEKKSNPVSSLKQRKTPLPLRPRLSLHSRLIQR